MFEHLAEYEQEVRVSERSPNSLSQQNVPVNKECVLLSLAKRQRMGSCLLYWSYQKLFLVAQ